VPVDFSMNTEVAINKALELIGQEEATLHLLHVNKAGHSAMKEHFPECEKKLNEWKDAIEDYHPLVTVTIWVEQGRSIQSSIKQKSQ